MATAERAVRRRYRNLSGDSGVRGYAVGPDFIDVWFKDNEVYRYDARKPGARHVAAMVRLAQAGKGLATYINQHVQKNYARKL
jgi:hypothetical protein